MLVELHSGRVWRNSNFSLFPSIVDIYAELLLTLIGRICIVKTLTISKLVYDTSVLKVSSNFAEKVNDICFKFIWNFKQTIVLSVDKGGLNMVDFSIVDKSLKAAWVKRFYEADGSKWCSVLASVTAQYGGRLSNRNLKHFLSISLQICRTFGKGMKQRATTVRLGIILLWPRFDTS